MNVRLEEREDTRSAPGPTHAVPAGAKRSRRVIPATVGLTVGSIGVVFGDIGTSPLYALRESFLAGKGIPVTQANVIGVCSVILWSLIVIITVKYLLLVMRAENHGEGGILALLALVDRDRLKVGTGALVAAVGLFGTALLYGDGMITPAISVLSAVEGFQVAAPSVEPWVVPMAAAILIGLFSVQRLGTGSVGAVFGPVMIVWFAVLSLLGVSQIVQEPGILAALNPANGVEFFMHNGFAGFMALGSIFLVATGAEALYADMGHFGRGPITKGWTFVVFPALVLAYLGQGAALLQHPGAIENVFYEVAPVWAVVPLAVLATCATVIASQALISGAFSLTAQAIQMGYSPRLRIEHTSRSQEGQLYVPVVNWGLLVACLALVFGFGSSSNLAAAYGIAVTMTMLITTMLLAVVARQRWRWSRARTAIICAPLLMIDLAFASANSLKLFQGGWIPLLVAAIVVGLFVTWRRGRARVYTIANRGAVALEALAEGLEENPPLRVPGTAVYLHHIRDVAPPALVLNLKTSHVLHEQVVVLTVVTKPSGTVPRARRVSINEIGDGLYSAIVRFGFAEAPDIPKALENVIDRRVSFIPEDTIYFLGHEAVIPTERRGLHAVGDHLFSWMARNANPATRYFGIPTDRAVEVGQQVQI